MDGIALVRLLLAQVVVFAIPAALSIWLLIHPFARTWRRVGPGVTYGVAVAWALVAAFGLYQLRDPLLRVEYGFAWPLTVAGVFLYLVAVFIEVKCFRHLSLTTLVGLPEISASRESRLLTEGIYGRMRHPRYVGLMSGTIACALFVNYLAAYVATVVILAMLHLVVLVEERELHDRFGDEYIRYMQSVPRYIPRIRRAPAASA